MKRSVERRIAALEARRGIDPTVDRLLTPCIIRQDACSQPPDACSFDDASSDNRVNVVDLQGWRSCSACRRKPTPLVDFPFTSPTISPGNSR
jgi:hypothetical protein